MVAGPLTTEDYWPGILSQHLTPPTFKKTNKKKAPQKNHFQWQMQLDLVFLFHYKHSNKQKRMRGKDKEVVSEDS